VARASSRSTWMACSTSRARAPPRKVADASVDLLIARTLAGHGPKTSLFARRSMPRPLLDPCREVVRLIEGHRYRCNALARFGCHGDEAAFAGETRWRGRAVAAMM
jgi:hypothetical protein